jgi:hypothetical protein
VKLTAVHRLSLTKISFEMTECDSCASLEGRGVAPAYRGEVRELCEKETTPSKSTDPAHASGP